MNKLLASSINPEQLSLTIKGILIGLFPLILFFFPDIAQAELQAVVDGILSVIIVATAALSAIVTLIGAVRKIVVKFSE